MRGRPAKPKYPALLRHALLPFQAERDYLTSQLRLNDRSDSLLHPVAWVADLPYRPEHPLLSMLALSQGGQLHFALNQESSARRSTREIDAVQRCVDRQPFNSRRSMTSDWLNWTAFCLHTGNSVLPSQFEHVKTFLEEMISAGRKRATIQHHAWTLAEVNRRHGFMSPFADPDGQAYRRGLEVRLPSPPNHPSGLNLSTVRALAHALLTKERPCRRSKPSDRGIVAEAQWRRSLRDAALVHTAYDLFGRARELIHLRWDQIVEDSSSGNYQVENWRENIDGQRLPFPLRSETALALEAWRAKAGPSPFVFHRVLEHERDHEPALAVDKDTKSKALELQRWPPISDREVGVLLRKAAQLAGITALRLSGRSALIGAVREMVEAGFTPLETGDLAGWKDWRMHSKYVTVALAKRRALEPVPLSPAISSKD